MRLADAFLAETARRLRTGGWLPPDDVTPAEAANALARFNRFFGTGQNADLTREAVTALEERRICSHPDQMAQRADACRWRTAEVGVYFHGGFPKLDAAVSRRAVERALGQWNEACGIRLTLTDRPDLAWIHATFGRIDGKNGVLGQSELPCGMAQRVNQKYDTGEEWDEELAFLVARHEIGHAIGIEHVAPVQGEAAMNPTLKRLEKLTPLDVAEAVARYPKRPGSPPPPPAEPHRLVIDPVGRTVSLPPGWKAV